MNFVIAKTFTKALESLDPQWHGPVEQAAFRFAMNPANPGFQFHRLDKARDPNFWSFRITQDIRGIVHKTDDETVLCYVGHHDDAYAWAERRVIREHEATGSIQVVEVVEREEERIIVRERVVAAPIFQEGQLDDDYLLALGVPREYLDAVRIVTEDSLDQLVEELPEEAGESILALACGEPVSVPTTPATRVRYEHPDSGRRFRVVDREEELRQALENPWERWIVFLHPRQRRVIEADYTGPALANGSAGTGKSVVAVHRAVELARQNPDAKILLTTFSRTLADDLRTKVEILVSKEGPELGQLSIVNLDKLAWHHYDQRFDAVDIIDNGRVRSLIANELSKKPAARALPGMEGAAAAAGGSDPTRSASFIFAEFDVFLDPWGIDSWEEYRDASRTGRGTGLGAKQRKEIWDVIEAVRAAIHDERGKHGNPCVTWNELRLALADRLSGEAPLFDHVVVDEAQDFGPADLKLLRALVPEQGNDLFFAGDIGQRIYKQPFSWQSVGIDIRGRSTKLGLNYRTTQQIRDFADKLMPRQVKGMGDDDSRSSVSLLSGDAPTVLSFKSLDEEEQGVSRVLEKLIGDGVEPSSIAIVLRAPYVQRWRDPADRAVRAAGLEPFPLASSDQPESPSAIVYVGSMHRAKGLEFDAVIVMGCCKEVLPWQKVLADLDDPADREAFLEQERNLLYVACTRARRFLFVTYSGEPSDFLGPALARHAGQTTEA